MTFTCHLSAAATPLKHAWEHTVGSSRALLPLRADWQEQLQRCHDELGFRYVRFHGLLDDDMGTLISHQEKPLYSFFNVDRIFDFLLSIGMRPFVELGFMPEMLASGHETVFQFRGNVTPPADYEAWTATYLWENLYGYDFLYAGSLWARSGHRRYDDRKSPNSTDLATDAGLSLYWHRITARRVPRRLDRSAPFTTDYDDAAGW